MRVEVRCPDCGNGVQVNRSSTGEMLCPKCMTRITLGGSAQAGSPRAAAPTPVPSKPIENSRHEPAPGPEAVEAASPEPLQATRPEPVEQIVCPRCKLHFFPRSPAVPAVDARRTILVVDDLQYFRKIAFDALSPGYQVKTAASRPEAKEILDGGGIDLVVLDLTLGGGEGGRQLLAELDPKPCPILIFTAQDESDMYGRQWEELSNLGADDLVIKGMNVAESLTRKAAVLLGTAVDDEGSLG